ncbi:MAG: T9SS type B sorting domain-containing protein [Flavobacteriaceae bacterium]
MKTFLCLILINFVVPFSSGKNIFYPDKNTMVSNDTLKNFRTTQNNSDCTASFTLNSSETHTNYTYNAENSIATESNYTVSELNNEIRMKAGKVIVLKPKTLIRKSSLYLARIEPCIACEISFSYPKFFTPNNDGVNDYWKIKWTTASDFSEVSIFDRYGKLLKILKKPEDYWNGQFNGTNVFSSDYWFRLEYDDCNGIRKEYKSHFSLKR